MAHQTQSRVRQSGKFAPAIKQLSLSCLMVGAVLLGWADSAFAGKSVLMKFRDISTIVALDDLKRLINTDESTDDLQAFWAAIPLTSNRVVDLLTHEINRIGLPLDEDDQRFVGIQIGKLIGDPLSRERPDEVEATLLASFAGDDQLTFLEMIENYPNSTVRIELNRLDRYIGDNERLARRIGPLLDRLLPALICECDLEAPETDADVSRRNQPFPSSAVSVVAQSPAGSVCRLTSTSDRTIALAEQVIPLVKGLEKKQTTVEDISAPWSEPMIGQAAAANRPSSLNARRVVITLGPVRRAFDIQDLTVLAETGKAPSQWDFYFKLAKLTPEQLQTVLTEEITVDFVKFEKQLRSLLGEYVLFRAGLLLSTPSGKRNIQALRSGLVLSAAADNRISLIEFLQNYPARELVVDGRLIIRLARRLRQEGVVRTTTDRLEDVFLAMQNTLADRICDCE